MRILKLMSDWTLSPERKKNNSYGGCGYYRTVKIAEQLSHEHEVTVWGNEWEKEVKSFYTTEAFFDSLFKKFDLVWTHYTHNDIQFAWLYTASRKYGKKLVMDLDDNFLEVHEKNPASKEYAVGSKKKAMLATILSFCDAITVSTLPLKEKIQAHIKAVHGIDVPIFVIPNYNDVDDWQFEHKLNNNGVVIGYMGSISHTEDLEMFLPALKTIMEKYPDVYFNLMGQLTHAQAKKVFKNWKQEVRERICLINPTSSFGEFPLWLSLQPWDIGIAPVIQSPFNECKSHIKWMEYSMYRIPTIASKVYPYYKDVLGIETIEDGETGLLAKDGEWVEKLELLINDKKLREKIGENAYIHVKKHWQYKDAKKHILSVVREIEKL